MHEAKVKFTGETEPGAKVFVGDWYANVTDDGHWSLILILEKGTNTVKFTAKDKAGNVAYASTTVTYEPINDEPKDIKFTANQKYGSCGEAIPYDFFWGTATPGATIYVESPYGGGTTKAGEKGHWEIKVKFPEAPVGTFGVVIESSDGGRAEFSFTVIEKNYEFSAKHKWDASQEPWNIYWGTGTPGTAVKVTSEYGSGVAEVNDHGEWELKVYFEAPANTPFNVNVSNEGKTKTLSFKIIEKVYEFSANHKWDASEEPWNIYWGTGTPGTAVKITSEYGSGVAEVNGDGHWEIKVYFEAPANTPFNVNVSNEGKTKTFTFKFLQ